MLLRLANVIRAQIDALVDQYDTRLSKLAGYSALPTRMRRELERNVLDLMTRCLEQNDDVPLVEYVEQRAAQVVTQEFDREWFQQAVAMLEEILMPLVETVEESSFMWRAISRAQDALWRFIDAEHQRIQESLRASEEIYQTIFDSTPIMFWLKDTHNRTVRINRAAATFEGVKPEDVTGKSAYDLYPHEQAEAFYQDDLDVIKSGRPKLGIVEQHTSVGIGELMWVETGKTPVRNDKGEIVGVLAFAVDITERKRQEQQVQASLTRRGFQIQTTTEMAQEIAAAPALDELFRRVVTLIKERFGYTHAQLFRYEPSLDAVVLVTGYGEAGQKMLAAGHQVAMSRGVVGTAAATGQSILAADVLQDNDWRPNSYLPDTKAELAVPIKLREKVLGILDVHSDQAGALTQDDQLLLEGLCGQIAVAMESTRLLEELRSREAQLSDALRIAQLAHWEYDVPNDRFTFNDQFYALLRTTAEREGGYTMPSAQYAQRFVYPDDAPVVGAEIQKALETTDPNYSRQLDHRIIYADGKVGYVTVRFYVEQDAQGRTVKTHGANQDITERKQVEAEREQLLAQQQKRAVQLQTAAEVSRAASSTLSLDELLPQAAELVRARFNLYYVGIFLVDEAGTWAMLRAGTGEAGQQMLAAGHRLKVGGSSMISECIVNQQARIALDVGEEAIRFDNPVLPLTRSELALPLISRGRIIGAVTIQSDQPAAFTADDIIVLQTMADQIGNAAENARLYEQSRAALQEVDAINRRLTGEAWESYLRRKSSQKMIWVSTDDSSAPAPLPEADETLSTGQIIVEPEGDQPQATVTAPIMLRGQTIGALRVQTPGIAWNEDVQTVLTSLASHIAQAAENARLLTETEERLARERALAEATEKIRRKSDVERILQTAAEELARHLKAAHVAVRVGMAGDADGDHGHSIDDQMA